MEINDTPESSLQWIDDLSNNDYAIIDSFSSNEFLNGLKHCLNERIEEDKFQKAAIGASERKIIDKTIRGDNIFWLDKSSSDDRIIKFFVLMDQFRDQLNRYCYLSLSDYEFHFAHYPIGTFYKRHLDQFQGRNNRLISCVLYLNEDWKKDDGGQLRLYLGDQKKDIIPKFGRLVLFKSAEIEHEVLATKADRFSITGWMLYRPIGLELI